MEFSVGLILPWCLLVFRRSWLALLMLRGCKLDLCRNSILRGANLSEGFAPDRCRKSTQPVQKHVVYTEKWIPVYCEIYWYYVQYWLVLIMCSMLQFSFNFIFLLIQIKSYFMMEIILIFQILSSYKNHDAFVCLIAPNSSYTRNWTWWSNEVCNK